MLVVNLPWCRLAMWWAVVHLAACASLGPQLPAPTGGEIESESLAFSVRTLGASGEFDLLSSGEVAQKLRAALAGRPLSVLALSSGGSNRAFGAGALAGSAANAPLPEFPVSTPAH